MSERAKLAAGTTFGHYRIVSELGSGGMGDVYIAEDASLGRQVALKVLPDDVAASPDRRERFEREARAVAALSHPNILAIHDFGEEDGVLYAVMVFPKTASASLRPAGFPRAPSPPTSPNSGGCT